MYIEFVGIPGAGKTRLVEEVEEALKKEGIQCTTRAAFFPKGRTWKYKLVWMLLHIQYLDVLISIPLYKLSRLKGSSFKKFVMRWHEHQKLQYQISCHAGTVVLWDAGYVQRFSNFVMKNILDGNEVGQLIFERIPKEESLLFFIDTPIGESILRMKKREPTRSTKGLSVSQSETKKAQESVLSSLNERGIKIIRIDGTKEIIENTKAICDSIKAYL